MTDLIVAATFLDRAEALIARGLLESEGLVAFVAELDLLGLMPHFIYAEGGYRLQVRSEDLETARAILRDAQLASSLSADE